MGKHADGKAQCSMEVLTGIKSSALVIRLSLLLQFKGLPDLGEEMVFEIATWDSMHQALVQYHKEMSDWIEKRRIRVQNL